MNAMRVLMEMMMMYGWQIRPEWDAEKLELVDHEGGVD
jgi:hypothetical protein